MHKLAMSSFSDAREITTSDSGSRRAYSILDAHLNQHARPFYFDSRPARQLGSG